MSFYRHSVVNFGSRLLRFRDIAGFVGVFLPHACLASPLGVTPVGISPRSLTKENYRESRRAVKAGNEEGVCRNVSVNTICTFVS